MAVKFFGQFMLEKGIVTQEQIVKAIALQESTNLKFGEMAKAMGFLTDKDIDRVHDAQRGEDIQFGDMCVKLSILSIEQLKEVLTKQKNSHVYIGEALVKVEAISAADLPKYLAEFKADQAPYQVGKIEVPAQFPHADLMEVIIDLSCKMLQRVANINFRRGPAAEVSGLEPNTTMVSIAISGSVKAKYILSVSASARTLIAKALLKADDVSREGEELLNDSVMELSNIICGNVAAKAAQIGKTIEISPPQFIDRTKGIQPAAGAKALMVPLYIADGTIELGVFLE